MKPGYIYVLGHPSYPNIYKIGITTRTLQQRLTEHNNDYSQYTGKIVKETGKKWFVEEYHKVPDAYWAETVFWNSTPYADIPYRRGIEVQELTREEVRKGLKFAINAGERPAKSSRERVPDHVYAYTARTRKRLEGRGITLIGHVNSMVSGKASFQCDNGHEWRAWCREIVFEGGGCPECGIGLSTKEEINQAINSGTMCLMTHSDNPGLVRFEICYEDETWEGWDVQHIRNIDETDLAEKLIWELLDKTKPEDNIIEIDFDMAKQALKNLDARLKKEIAIVEMSKESM